MGKNNITFVIFAYNEEKRIEYPVCNFVNYGEVIVIDNFSEDGTKATAEKFGAKVYQYKNPGYVETQEELDFVRSKINTDYMTWSFADHMWDKALLEDTIQITREGKYDGIAARNKSYHYGLAKLNFASYNFKWRDSFKVLCIYKKNLLYCSGVIHSNLKNRCKNIFYMPQNRHLLHNFQGYNTKKILTSYNRYSDIDSEMRFKKGEKVSFLKLFVKTLSFFCLYYFIEGGWKSGKAGFIAILQNISYYFYVGSKQRELENQVTLNSIEDSYAKIKIQILNEIDSSKTG